MSLVSVHCSYHPKTNWNQYSFPQCRHISACTIWRAAISDHEGVITYFLTLVSAEEKERSERFHQLKDQQRFILGRGMLRLLLSHYLSIPPAQLTICKEKNGKLFVKEALEKNIHFNLSHSGNWVLIAISFEEVGVDVERMVPDYCGEEVINYNFSPAEKKYIQQSPDPIHQFYQFWTRKEALLKATGIGLINHLPEVSCLVGINNVQAASIASDKDWKVVTFPVDEDHMGSLACQPSQAFAYYDFNVSCFLKPPLQTV